MKVLVDDIKALVNQLTHRSIYALLKGAQTVELIAVLRLLISKATISASTGYEVIIKPDSLARIIDSYFNGNSAILYFIRENINLNNEELGLALYRLHFYTNNYPNGTITQLSTIKTVKQLADLLGEYDIPLQGVINKSCKYSTNLRNELNKEKWSIDLGLKQIKQGAPPQVKDRRGDIFLHRVLNTNSTLLTCTLTLCSATEQKFAVNYHDNLGRTVLHHALDGYVTFKDVELLVKLGSNPNTLNSEGKSYLFLAMDHSGSNSGHSVEKAIRLGCDHSQLFKRKNALQYCLDSIPFNLSDALFLVKYGFDPLTVNSNKHNILHCLMKYNPKKLSPSDVQLAINAKVSVHQANYFEQTPYDYLLTLSFYYSASAEDLFAIAKMFINAAEDKATKNAWGNRLLLVIAGKKLSPSFSLKPVLELTSDVNYKDKNGETALCALLKSSPSTFEHIKELIEGGADVNTVDKFGNNILHLLIRRSRIEYLSNAAKFGVNINHKNNNQQTPYELFLARSHKGQSFPVELIPDNASLASMEVENKKQIQNHKAIRFNSRLWFLGDDIKTQFAEEGSAIEFQHNSGL